MQSLQRRKPHARFIVAVVVWLCSVAQADPAFDLPKDPQALSHLLEGNKVYSVTDFEKAIVEYKAGALIEPIPLWDYNLAQCYRFLGRFKQSIFLYQRFLSRGHPTDPDAVAQINEWLKQMQAELDREAKAKTTPAIPQLDDPWYGDRFGWSLFGAGAVALGVAGYFFWDAASIDDQANEQAIQTRRNELQSQASTRNKIGVAVGAGGLALIAGAVFKFALHKNDREPPKAVKTSLSLRLAVDGFAVGGTF